MPPVTPTVALKGAFISPELTDGQLIVGPLIIVKGQLLADTTPLASVTWMVKAPAAVGVPVIAPVDAFSDSPAGNVPLATEKISGDVPPLTPTVALKAAFTSPELTDGQLIDGPLMMVKGQLLVATTPLASVTWMEKVPAAVGVPVMAPDEEFSVRPAGSAPLATEKR